MHFTDEEVKILLEVLVCSKDNEGWRIQRYKDHNRWRDWINPIRFAQLDLDEIKDKFLEYYNEGMRRYPPIPIQRENIIKDMNKLRETIRFLLDESVPVNERINEILDSDGKYYIKGLGRQTITSILMDLNPNSYATWNKTTKKGLEFLGRYPVLPRGSDWGAWYEKVMESIENIRKLHPVLNIIEIDHFLYIVSSTKDGEDAVKDLKEGKLKSSGECQSIEMILGKPNDSGSMIKYDREKQEPSKLDRMINELQKEFSNESIAKISYIVEREVNYERNHGKIVNKLEEVLRQKGFILSNTKEIDLFVKEGNKITKVFEIKTDSDSSSLQKGIGQLILYTLNLDEKPNLFLVLPEAIESNKQQKLKEKLNIDILLYNLKEEDITFIDLDHKVLSENLKE